MLASGGIADITSHAMRHAALIISDDKDVGTLRAHNCDVRRMTHVYEDDGDDVVAL